MRVALFLIAYLLILLAASVPKGMTPPPYGDLVWGLVSSIALLALNRAVIARWPKRELFEIIHGQEGGQAALRNI